MVAGAIIGGVASVGSAVLGANASQNAADTQANAANYAANLANQRYQQTRTDLQPYNQAGQNALTSLQGLLGLKGGTAGMQSILQNLPGYQFTLNQGLKSVQNSAAARGLGSSGAALRGAADYTTGLAQSQYGNYFNQLLSTSQLGENAGAQTGVTGAGLAQTAGNAAIAAGNAGAAGILGGANAYSNALTNGANLYLTNSLLNKYGGGGGGSANAASVGWGTSTGMFPGSDEW